MDAGCEIDGPHCSVQMAVYIPERAQDLALLCFGTPNKNWITFRINKNGSLQAEIVDDSGMAHTCTSTTMFGGLLDISRLGLLHIGIQFNFSRRSRLEIILDGEVVCRLERPLKVTRPVPLIQRLGSDFEYGGNAKGMQVAELAIWNSLLSRADLRQTSQYFKSLKDGPVVEF